METMCGVKGRSGGRPQKNIIDIILSGRYFQARKRYQDRLMQLLCRSCNTTKRDKIENGTQLMLSMD